MMTSGSQRADASAGTGITSLFRLRNARIYFVGASLSLFGDSILSLAAGIWIKSLTGNDGAAGLTAFFVMLPTLFSPVFGLLADRVRKRTLMIATNAVMTAIPPWLLLVNDSGDVWLIYLVMLAQGTAVLTLASSSNGLFVEMFPQRLLGTANSLVTSLQEGMKVIAPAVGAALFVLVGGGLIGLIDALTFVAACLALLALRVNEPEPVPSERRLRDELVAGVRHIALVPDLRRLVTSAALIMLTVGFVVVALYGVIDSDLHRPPEFLGVVLAMQGIGSVLGGLLATRLVTVLGEVRLVGVGAALIAVGTAALLIPATLVVLPGSLLRGVGLAWMIIGAITVMQRLTPANLMGRTASALYLLVFGPNAVSLLTGAGLVNLVSHRVMIAVTAIVTAGVCVYLLAGRSRPAEEPQPESEEAL
jgi:MFS family permease